MKRREFYQRLQAIDPEDSRAMEQLAELFEEDYVTAGENLTDPAVAEDIRARAQADMEYFMAKYNALLEKINFELRRAGATDAQINWGLFGNVELPTVPYLLCNFRARKLIRLSYRILYCLAELNMIGKYTEVDGEKLERIRRDYGRRFG